MNKKFDKIAYNRNYRKVHYKRFRMDLDIEKDKDILEILEGIPNKKAYIIDLIRKDKGGN